MKQKLVGIFLMGLFLFNYPILSLFSQQHWIHHIPVLYFYLFAVWLVLIGLAYGVAERSTNAPPAENLPRDAWHSLGKKP